MKIKYFVALYVAKSAQTAMRLLGRNATFLPGKLAEKLCKNFLSYMTPPKTVIAVTGTNGKTTVSNLLTSILQDNGYSVTNNSFGSNVQAGIISALVADTKLSGKPKKDIAVLEVDERSSLRIYPYMKPDYLLCNNLMRDSIKRNAHTEFIQFIVDKALPASTKLVLNADDLIASGLGTKGQERVHFGLEAEIPEATEPQHIRDIVYCPQCGELLQSQYVRYNHIGRHYCPKCGLKSPVPDYCITEIDRDKNTFTLRHGEESHTYNLINDNIVNAYNFCGAIAVLTEIGLTPEQISKGFADSKIVKTRYEQVDAGDLHITMLMAKGQNPIACARCYDYAARVADPDKALLLIVDDKDDNIGNSESTCWLYDCDYRALKDASIRQIVFAGPRCKDHYLRALLAGVDAQKIRCVESAKEGANAIDTTVSKHIMVLFEMYRADEAAMVKKVLKDRGERGV